MALWIGIPLAVIAFIVWFYTPGKGHPRSLAFPGALFLAIKNLHDLGMEGAEVRVEVKGDPTRYVTLTKHIRGQANIELVGVLQERNLSAEQSNALRDMLAEKRITLADTGSDNRHQLNVQLGSNLNNAELFVNTAMEIAFGANVSSDCVAYGKRIVIWNKPSLTGVPNP